MGINELKTPEKADVIEAAPPIREPPQSDNKPTIHTNVVDLVAVMEVILEAVENNTELSSRLDADMRKGDLS